MGYGVYLLVVSDRMMSIPPFLTAARTAFDDPISIPVNLKNKLFTYCSGTCVHNDYDCLVELNFYIKQCI